MEKICASPVRFRSPVYRRTLQDLSRTPERLRLISRGDQLAPWTILHPQPDDRFSQADDNALVLSGTVCGTRVLLLSDLGQPGQEVLLARNPDLRTHILVTGLPVRNEAVCDAFFDTVQPRVIVLADSEIPASERASPKLQERLARRKVPVIYTRSAGAATIEWRGDQWELRTMNGVKITGNDPSG